MRLTIQDSKEIKIVSSPEYNFYFDKTSGFFARWGKTRNDDPTFAPSPEILDIEITTKCKGPDGKLCPFCYKSNSSNGHNMSFETFKTIIDKMPKTLCQIALGADAQGTSNPDMFAMMEYSRSIGIIPNLTIADVSDEVAQKLSKVAGAVAVSVYHHAGKQVAYNSIKMLQKYDMEQVNIHFMISKETLGFAFELMNDYKNQIIKPNAIIFLSLKKKGRGARYETVSEVEYKQIVDFAFESNIPIGFDSCSAPTFAKAIKNKENYEKIMEMVEPCESTCFSSYINEHGNFYPCSFTEHWEEGGWSQGLDVVNCKDFVKDIWNNEKTVKFRENLISNLDENKCRNCPAFEICGTFMKKI